MRSDLLGTVIIDIRTCSAYVVLQSQAPSSSITREDLMDMFACFLGADHVANGSQLCNILVFYQGSFKAYPAHWDQV
jgi:hypothetical protein